MSPCLLCPDSCHVSCYNARTPPGSVLMACSVPLVVIPIALSGSQQSSSGLISCRHFRGMFADGMWRDTYCHYKGKAAAVMIRFYTVNFLSYWGTLLSHKTVLLSVSRLLFYCNFLLFWLNVSSPRRNIVFNLTDRFLHEGSGHQCQMLEGKVVAMGKILQKNIWFLCRERF